MGLGNSYGLSGLKEQHGERNPGAMAFLLRQEVKTAGRDVMLNYRK